MRDLSDNKGRPVMAAVRATGRPWSWVTSRPTEAVSPAAFADRLDANRVDPAADEYLAGIAASGSFDVLIGGEFLRLNGRAE